MSGDLFQRLQESSYSEEDLNKVIDFVWALDEKHPSLWTAICKRLIITLMKERMEAKALHLKMTQALYTAQKAWTR